MEDFYALLSLAALLPAVVVLVRMFRPRGLIESALLQTVVISTLLVLVGYLLSACNLLSHPGWWATALWSIFGLSLLPCAFSPALRARCLRKVALPYDIERRIRQAGLRTFESRLLLTMVFTVAICALINFFIILWLEPANHDVFQYHLARVIYYWQHGNLNYFPATYWAVTMYPKVATLLLLYAFLLSGKIGGLTQLVQYLAYFISLLAVYGICRHLGASRKGSTFAALVTGLLIIFLMEAATAQNDLLMTAYLGCVLYGVLAYRADRQVKDLALAGVAFALLIGVKFTFLLLLPSLCLIALYMLWPRRATPHPHQGRHLAIGLAVTVTALVMITLPSGYWDNYRLFHDPFGDPATRNVVTGEHRALPALLHDGSLNLCRYAFDFLTFDGIPAYPWVQRLTNGLHYLPRTCLEALHLHPESRAGINGVYRFDYQTLRGVGSENVSYWGVFGFLLIWPVVLLALGWRRAPNARLFAAAAVLFYIVQAFASYYDPLRGRFFTMGALFAVPTVAFLLPARTHWLPRGYLALVVTLGCLSALCASVYRSGTYMLPFIDERGEHFPPTFRMDRISQLCRESPQLTYAFLAFDSIPKHAVVAMDTNVVPEYILFGDHFTRRLFSLRPCVGPRQPIPADATFLLCSPDSPYHRKSDYPIVINDRLQGTLYLRKLK